MQDFFALWMKGGGGKPSNPGFAQAHPYVTIRVQGGPFQASTCGASQVEGLDLGGSPNTAGAASFLLIPEP